MRVLASKWKNGTRDREKAWCWLHMQTTSPVALRVWKIGRSGEVIGQEGTEEAVKGWARLWGVPDPSDISRWYSTWLFLVAKFFFDPRLVVLLLKRNHMLHVSGINA
jgi:hypothetical protein